MVFSTPIFLFYFLALTLLIYYLVPRRLRNPVLLCAIRRREIVWVRRVVKELDPNAFFIVCDAREVLGEGFGEYDANGL